MNVKKFIDRPIFSGVISVVIVFVGLIGLNLLPVEQFPEIAPPTVSVSASYTGASAETVQKSIIVPLEEALNGVENMLYMNSTASTGSASISIFFRQGTDPNMAMVNVQNYLSSATGQLPSEVTKSGLTIRKSQSSTLKILSIYSPDSRYDDVFLTNYGRINLETRLSRITGVGSVDIMGPSYALRIWLDPYKMAQYSLMPSDIQTLLDEQNVEYATGTLGDNSVNTFQYDLKYKGRLESEEDFENLVIKSLENGKILHLKDVADIELGANNYEILGGVNGRPGKTMMISQAAGSNANEVIDNIDVMLEEIRAELPEGIDIVDLMSTKDFLDASIDNVIKTLIEAILLVILVVYIFLQNLRSTLIPTISIFVALIGTFGVLYAIGFTINLLTLFALVLVIGTVVDDAIVVVEAVQSKFDAGEKSAYKASVTAMNEISGALITTSIVFMAVFIPVCFMGGTTGTFYTQFGLTMAIAVALSTVNALTLSPALCALIMTPHKDYKPGEKLSFSTRFHHAFDAAFNRIINKYKNQVFFFLKFKYFAFLLVLIAGGALYYLSNTTKSALIPNEDNGTMYINIQASTAQTRNETKKVVDEIERRLQTIPEIKGYSNSIGRSRVGTSGANGGMFVVRLADWSERKGKDQSLDAIVNKIYAMTADLTEANILVITPPMITGFGVSSGFEIHVQDKKGGDINELFEYSKNFIAKLQERPEIARAQTTFDNRYPQYLTEVDAELCERNGVSPTDVLNVVSSYIGGSYASNIIKYSKLYRVMMQAHNEDRLDLQALENMYVRNSDGEMSPVSNYLTITKEYGSSSLARFNMYSSIQVNGSAADGYSSGQALAAIAEVAAETLPVGYGYELGGMSREESSSGGSTTIIIFSICIIFVYLILCALYESMFIPLAVILSLPFGLMGSFLFARMFGLANDIYMQTGLIMLIGLMGKTAILLTEYASERRAAGMSISQAAITAAKIRLRPILMTSLTLIFGMLPLMFASGVGANGNISLGVGVVGGMLIGTIALVFVVPALFVIFQGIEERVMPQRVLPKIDETK
ncbi:MAG: efflux RND transporter permease subunit [Rikenellaceae bacterium]